MGGLALFHTVHRNLGPDGPSAFKFGLCGSMLVDFRVDVGRFVLAEGRACWGQVKTVPFQNQFQKSKRASRKIVCGKSSVERTKNRKMKSKKWNQTYFVKNAKFPPKTNIDKSIWDHICYISIKLCTCTFPLGNPAPRGCGAQGTQRASRGLTRPQMAHGAQGAQGARGIIGWLGGTGHPKKNCVDKSENRQHSIFWQIPYEIRNQWES